MFPILKNILSKKLEWLFNMSWIELAQVSPSSLLWIQQSENDLGSGVIKVPVW